MYEHSDWYNLFSSFWWLLFPLFWMVGTAAKTWSRHARANRVLDLVKSYVDQGKEPPAELLKILQNPLTGLNESGGVDMPGPQAGPPQSAARQYLWVPVFLFAALAVGFFFLAATFSNGTRSAMLIFVGLVMVGLALGNLVAVLGINRNNTLPK
jgi:hypothetical protein